ncbi:MAG: NmrA family NAD(P)-binding protein [Ignavibacteriales bacterium]|nr:NmrA family NAD(P)-binding protein [Ignavibacteriales bacterium]
MYVITGATGNTGRPIATALLNTGKRVRIISRNQEKAKDLVSKGAELFVGETSDIKLLTEAFRGADAVYAMIPPDFTAPDFYKHQTKHADAMAEAVKQEGVKYVVSLSSVGTHLEKESGVVFGLRYMEQKFNSIPGLNVLHLRPTYFMENSFSMIEIIKKMGIMGSPIKSDLRMNMIAAKDIAEYAAKRLSSLDFSGKSIQYLLGQRDLTYSDVARIFGNEIGKQDLKYIEFSFDEFTKAMVGMGASPSMAENMNTFIKSMNEGKVLAEAKRTPQNTTPTSIEEFAKTFAYLYNKTK